MPVKATSLRSIWKATSLFLILGLAAGGCARGGRPGASAGGVEAVVEATLTAVSALASPSPSAAPATPVVVLSTHVPEEPAARLPQVSATPLPDPIRFTFPTQGAEPISLWRAPLYPVPWEPTPSDHFYFIRPIGANEINWPLARYRYGYLLYAEPHSGIDVPAPKGTPVMAAGGGTVIWAGYGLYFMRDEFKDPYGIAVAIRHDFGYNGQSLYTVYGHLDQTFVTRGQRVEAGEQIGVVGETGKVSGPHLHFEVRVGDSTFFESRNPELWIAPPQGTGVLVGRISDRNGDPAPRITVKLFAVDGTSSYEVVSYAKGAVNSDDYYQENVVLGDIPAGKYTLYLEYEGVSYKTDIIIQAGLVTYFTFRTRDGYGFDLPSLTLPPSLPTDPAAQGTVTLESGTTDAFVPVPGATIMVPTETNTP